MSVSPVQEPPLKPGPFPLPVQSVGWALGGDGSLRVTDWCGAEIGALTTLRLLRVPAPPPPGLLLGVPSAPSAGKMFECRLHLPCSGERLVSLPQRPPAV